MDSNLLYLSDMQPAYCPKCGKPMDPRLHGWEALDRFHNAKQPFLCDCGARYLLKEEVVVSAFDHSEPVGAMPASTAQL